MSGESIAGEAMWKRTTISVRNRIFVTHFLCVKENVRKNLPVFGKETFENAYGNVN